MVSVNVCKKTSLEDEDDDESEYHQKSGQNTSLFGGLVQVK